MLSKLLEQARADRPLWLPELREALLPAEDPRAAEPPRELLLRSTFVSAPPEEAAEPEERRDEAEEPREAPLRLDPIGVIRGLPPARSVRELQLLPDP